VGASFGKRSYLVPMDFQEFPSQRTASEVKIKTTSKISFPIFGDDAIFFSHFVDPPFI
jgi:hypothetical protein